MSNLKLVPDDPTPLEKMLLDASRAELPSEAHKARLRAVLGIGAPLPHSGPLAAPDAGQTAARAAPPATAAAKSTTAAKLAVGLGILAVAGVLWFTRERDAAPVPPPPVVVAVAPVAVAPAPSVPAAEPVAVSSLPPAPAASVVPRSRSNAAPTSAAPEDLSEQIRLIEAARAGVASRDSKAALAALDTYAAKFSRGSFGQEALVLRIRALDQAGDSARATALAKSFLARFPASPHVARLKPIAERGASR